MYLDLGRWKQDLHGARMDPRPEEASLLQHQSTSQGNMGDSEPPDILCESKLTCACIIHRAACSLLVKHSTIITSWDLLASKLKPVDPLFGI